MPLYPENGHIQACNYKVRLCSDSVPVEQGWRLQWPAGQLLWLPRAARTERPAQSALPAPCWGLLPMPATRDLPLSGASQCLSDVTDCFPLLHRQRLDDQQEQMLLLVLEGQQTAGGLLHWLKRRLIKIKMIARYTGPSLPQVPEAALGRCLHCSNEASKGPHPFSCASMGFVACVIPVVHILAMDNGESQRTRRQRFAIATPVSLQYNLRP